jgi:hypothetical protein
MIIFKGENETKICDRIKLLVLEVAVSRNKKNITHLAGY